MSGVAFPNGPAAASDRRRLIGLFAPSNKGGLIVAGAGGEILTQLNGGAVADTGTTAGRLFSTSDVTQDYAFTPRAVMIPSATRTHAGIRYSGYDGFNIPNHLGPNPAAGVTPRKQFGTLEFYDTVRIDSVITHDNTLPVWAHWGLGGLHAFANNRFWGCGVFFFAQAAGEFGFPAAAASFGTWQAIITGQTLNIANPTPVLYGPVNLGVPFTETHRLGLIIDAIAEATPRVRWVIDGTVLATFTGPLASTMSNGIATLPDNASAPRMGAYLEDSTTTDRIELRWHIDPAYLIHTLPADLP